jgi:hypothetical protein
MQQSLCKIKVIGPQAFAVQRRDGSCNRRRLHLLGLGATRAKA